MMIHRSGNLIHSEPTQTITDARQSGCRCDLARYNPGAMRIVVVLALLFFRAVVFADQPAPIRPDPKLTPGATFDATLQDISEPGYSKKIRNVTGEVKREVYAEYGITEHQPGEY
jgi:hypothetical protein